MRQGIRVGEGDVHMKRVEGSMIYMDTWLG